MLLPLLCAPVLAAPLVPTAVHELAVDGDVRAVGFSRDGDALVATTASLLRWKRPGRPPTSVNLPELPEFGFGSFSPDGTGYAWFADGQLHLIEVVNGGLAGKIALDRELRHQHPVWSASGRYVGTGGESLDVVDVETGTVTRRALELRGPNASRSLLAFIGPHVLLEHPGESAEILLDPDAKRWTAWDHTKRIYQFYRDRGPEPYLSIRTPYSTNVVVSADGKAAYEAVGDQTLWAWDLTQPEPTHIVAPFKTPEIDDHVQKLPDVSYGQLARVEDADGKGVAVVPWYFRSCVSQGALWTRWGQEYIRLDPGSLQVTARVAVLDNDGRTPDIRSCSNAGAVLHDETDGTDRIWLWRPDAGGLAGPVEHAISDEEPVLSSDGRSLLVHQEDGRLFLILLP